MRASRKKTARKPFAPPSPAPPSPEVIALGESLEKVFSEMEARINQDLPGKVVDPHLTTRISRGLRDSSIRVEIQAKGGGYLCGFSISTTQDLGRISLRLDVSSTFCDVLEDARMRFSALTTLMGTIDLWDKEFLQVWEFKTGL